jgi:MFS family permease
MSSHNPYAAFQSSRFRLFFAGNVLATLGMQMQATAVGWEIYDRTKSELALGFVGMVQFLPVVSLALVTGQAADRFNRRWIVIVSLLLMALSSIGLTVVSTTRVHFGWMYVFLLTVGIARAFQQPAKQSLLPHLVPIEHFASAVTWNTTAFHLSTVVGPAVGGLLIEGSDLPALVYVLDVVATLSFVGALLFVDTPSVKKSTTAATWRDLIAGVHFLRRNPIVLSAITLDMFAVLLGGAVTLLPVFARDILHTEAAGLGWLRAAPGMGAIAMAIVLAYQPPNRRAGRTLLVAVAGFGLATIVFGYSTNFLLSCLALFVAGAFDNVSVVIRHTLIQTLTPDHLRGRVSAVNSLFIGASNELGGFESGLVAHYFGPVFSVVSGGVGTIVVVLITAASVPGLRRLERLGRMGH